MRLTAAIIQEGPWYVARCLEVEVASQGETVEEARTNLTEALELCFEGDSVIAIHFQSSAALRASSTSPRAVDWSSP